MRKTLSYLRKFLHSHDWFRVALWVLLTLGVIVRIIKLPLMEFKGDEFHFLTQSFLHPFSLSQIHEVRSAVPIPHPPSFAYFLAFPASMTVDPIAVTASIVWVNLIALWMFYAFCRRLFSKDAALISTALLASMPWAVIFSRKIWNPDLVIPLQILFLLGFSSLLRQYKPWKLYLFVVLLVLFLQAHLLSLFSVIPAVAVLLVARLPITRKQSVYAGAIFSALFIPYLSYMFGFADEPSTFVRDTVGFGLSPDIFQQNLGWWMKTSTGLGFEYLLGESGYTAMLDIYHLSWTPYVFMAYVITAICAFTWVLSKMLKEIFFKKTEQYPPSLLILLFLVLWGALLPTILTAAQKVAFPHYWVSIIIVLPICFGVVMYNSMRKIPPLLQNILRSAIVLVVGTQVVFMMSFYSFLEHHHEKIAGDYGTPYMFEQSRWERDIENTANRLE